MPATGGVFLMKRILLIDNEVQVLKDLTRLFEGTEYEVVTAQSGAEALEKLQYESVKMVVSDVRMPDMDGYELLAKIKAMFPKIMRVILCGYSDEQIVFKALQKNIAKLYILKPWEDEKFRNLVEQMFETERILGNTNLLSLINNIENLPTIQTNYQRILDLIDDRDADISRIAFHIEKDASISAKILQVANSAFYGMKSGSVRQAVSYIGLDNTKKLILSTSIIDAMNESGPSGKAIDSIWKQSFLSNRLLAFIYERHLGRKVPDAYSTAALLQNIGMIFFLKYFKTEYLKLRQFAQKNKVEERKLEKDIFNASHTEVGGYLLQWWDLPYPIIEAALFHHDPLDKSVINRELLYCTHIANEYALEMSDVSSIFTLEEKVFDLLNFTKEEFETSLSDFKAQ
jgi:HD-like signal output (HDOD) protein